MQQAFYSFQFVFKERDSQFEGIFNDRKLKVEAFQNRIHKFGVPCAHIGYDFDFQVCFWHPLKVLSLS